MRRFAQLFVFVTILSGSAGFSFANGDGEDASRVGKGDDVRPNIVFLLADDQSTYSVGCYGNPDVKTPNMDRLARDGVLFDNHYNTTAICMASRANIFTGMYEYKTGCNFMHGDMKPEVWELSYPVALRKAGYLTAFAGKFGLVVEGKGLCEEDFDFWGGGPGQTSYATASNRAMKKYAKDYPHSTLSYAAFAQDVIRESVNQEKPFCLSISFKAPHKPAVPDPRFDAVYKDATFTKPANFGREHGEHLSPQSKMGRQYPRFSEWKYDTDYDGEMRKYHQQIYGIDVALGMIRDELDAQGIADNTVVIYTSDNGYICGSHGYGSKVLPMEESSRVPLMIYDPRSPLNGQQVRCQALTGNIDFAATIVELAGESIHSDSDGISLLPLLKDPNADGHEQIAFINAWGSRATTSMTCITPRFKYTYWWYGDDEMEPVEELFDTEKDPLELTNLASNPEYSAVLEKMRARYDQELDAWKTEAVSYNDYEKYGTLFDRTVPLADKAAALGKKRKKNAGR
ncbi:sulfatase family protein [Rhodopirellula sallentina]|uniref:Mucin-desulfating sulfatase (N-acetylglucosamine-6-sulfatase) n=1 Tax=Rhodopirellula sallentina SM41 TaxID=1263870 RepID=M5UFX2_9BACT|nr:sulfatase [Rhodopirellula sallentina]EMI54908.1 mucin-desulfating sulfatase (N-acetylglucosamine-6-sulfatase) [Rhodopirellula sallentina SM41]